MGDYNVEGNLLLKFEYYEYLKEYERLSIKVGNALAGKIKDEYIAIPHLLWRESKEEYFGYGKTADEALRNCLDKIKGLPNSDILENPSQSNESA